MMKMTMDASFIQFNQEVILIDQGKIAYQYLPAITADVLCHKTTSQILS